MARTARPALKATTKSPVTGPPPGADPPVAGVSHGDGHDRVDPPVDFPDRGPTTQTAQPAERVSVDVDTLIARADIGPNASTFVAAGHAIPLGLEHLPRTPA